MRSIFRLVWGSLILFSGLCDGAIGDSPAKKAYLTLADGRIDDGTWIEAAVQITTRDGPRLFGEELRNLPTPGSIVEAGGGLLLAKLDLRTYADFTHGYYTLRRRFHDPDNQQADQQCDVILYLPQN